MIPYERTILSRHPDELCPEDMIYLTHPFNAALLAEYEATWADVIGSRRRRQPSTSPALCSSLPSSSS